MSSGFTNVSLSHLSRTDGIPAQREAKWHNQGYFENLSWIQLFEPYTLGLDHKTILSFDKHKAGYLKMTARGLALWLLFSWGTSSSQIWDVLGNAEERGRGCLFKRLLSNYVREDVAGEMCLKGHKGLWWRLVAVGGLTTLRLHLIFWKSCPRHDGCNAWLVSLDQDSVVSWYRKWLRGGMRSKPCWWAEWLQGTVTAGL